MSPRAELNAFADELSKIAKESASGGREDRRVPAARAIKDMMDLVSLTSILERITDKDSRVLYNPFNKGESPHNRTYDGDELKGLLSESFKLELQKILEANRGEEVRGVSKKAKG
jgi:hypothetical protein